MKLNFQKLLDAIFKIRTIWIAIFLPALILGIFFFGITLNNVFTETYDIERFTNAKQTIRSPITIENEQETERKTRETVQAVEDRYLISEEVTHEQVGYVEEIFDAIEKLENELVDPDETSNDGAPVALTNQDNLIRLKEILSQEIVENVNDSLFLKLMEIPVEEREEGKKVFLASMTDVLENGVRTENKNSRINVVKESVKYTTLDQELINALEELSEFAIVENSFYDAEKTMEARKEAGNSVDPVLINAGEIIVREGQTITNEVYEKLKLVGLLNNERNIFPVVGLAILIFMIVSVITYEMKILHKKNKLDKGKVLSILLVSMIVVSLMKVVSLYTTQTNQLFFIVPVATGVLLLKLLINERLAIVMATLYAIIGSIIFNSQIPGALNVEAGIYFFFSQIAGIIFLRNVKDRFAIVKSGLGMSLANILTVLLFVFLSFEKYSLLDLLIYSGYGVASAFLSAVLTIGLLSYFESGLGILSDVKLLQLSSPNQPLLKKILTEAPGTYHHSIMVANLSETACEAIGANGLLARVGAYYHDIGKTIRPHYFIENQLAIKNPHDVMSPRQSAEIIINHPYDGAELLKKHKLPKEIIDIAMQHHGTTLLKYFYYKEKETNKNVKEEDYRYPGPKPKTKEAAIICICDSVEAAVRSLKEPTEEKIEEIVSSIVNDRLMDGQLDECPLTLKEVKIIHQIICETLKGIFHSRIQYPIKEAK
ncbi:HDIG domain-containing protein [Ornithinibacillus sp. L9]|uniref:HDIG domain-containing protein n=1 Tax=Ornithinibacillus caprae TaxID=2678566 RepID=A0A6N8FBQ5_9BACI|nr:HDIG domain-containing protein [Ornithinibacillus caprae]